MSGALRLPVSHVFCGKAVVRMASLMGTFYHNIDAKGRLNFPTKLRELLGTPFYITKGLDQPCLTVYSETEWERLSAKLAAIPETKSNQMKRWLFSGAGTLIPDKQGRVLIPQDLRQFAGLEKDVVIIGADNKAEIWEKSRWDALNAAVDVQQMLKTLEELGF